VPYIALVGSDVTAGNLEEGYSVREYAHDIGTCRLQSLPR
jgi:hypothetical protein